LICRSGNRTDAVARELVKMGYTQVYNVRNGINRWLSDGHPVVKD
ncbi:MAG: sulfurtransferase, partial [Gammaproteobacteria bacterium]|nr:sulfurtransferase [Gammaproteobacteria bacterium]